MTINIGDKVRPTSDDSYEYKGEGIVTKIIVGDTRNVIMVKFINFCCDMSFGEDELKKSND